LNVHYRLISDRFQSWFDNWLLNYGPVIDDRQDNVKTLIRPVLSRITLPAPIIREIDGRFKSEPCTHARCVKQYDTAMLDESGNFIGKYRTGVIMTFEILRETNILQFNCQIGPSGPFAAANLLCNAVDKSGNTLKFSYDVQEITRQGDRLRTFKVYFLFDQPLTSESSDQLYYLKYEIEADDPYPNLGTAEFSTLVRWGGADELIMAVAFPGGKAGRRPLISDMAIVPPERRRAIGCDLDQDEIIVPSDEMAVHEFMDLLRLDGRAERYYLVGRRAVNIQSGQGIGFVIE
jgi:hypothetical protein